MHYKKEIQPTPESSKTFQQSVVLRLIFEKSIYKGNLEIEEEGE
jgi:hypothetical protein